ncbi:MAG: hypothetical protein IPK60_17725 [Sandaracinaceae bacterium]|nr:hypothetical protein [Sandaracinaceae bacterium]
MRKLILASLVLTMAACGDDAVNAGTDMGTASDLGTAADLGAPVDLGVSADLGAPVDAGAPVITLVDCPATEVSVIDASYEAGFGTVGAPNFIVSQIVKIHNLDAFPHTVTQRTESTGTPVSLVGGFEFSLEESADICIRFDAPGTFPYYCEFHTSMQGVFNVIQPTR